MTSTINFQDNRDCNVLHYLAKTISNLKFINKDISFYDSDNYIILEALFKCGISVNIQDNKDNTALHYAICNIYFIRELITYKANPFVLNKAGVSSLDYLNTEDYNLKKVIIDFLYCKYLDFAKLVEDKIMLLGDNGTLENIDDNA